MTTELRVPALGMGMTEGILAEWLAENGAEVQEGTPIYALETDKSVQEVESPASGILHITGKVGETYPVDDLIGTIE